MPALKIISDGTVTNTKVTTMDGKLIGRVQKVIWEADIKKPLSKCTIEIIGMPIEIDRTDISEIKYINHVKEDVDNVLNKFSQRIINELRKPKESESINDEQFIKEVIKIKEEYEKERKEEKINKTKEEE